VTISRASREHGGLRSFNDLTQTCIVYEYSGISICTCIERTSDLFLRAQVVMLGLGGVRIERVGLGGRHVGVVRGRLGGESQ